MPKSTNPLRRSGTASPFATAQRRKPGIRTAEKSNQDALDCMNDVGLVPHLATSAVPQDVVGIVKFIGQHAFDDIPDRAAGMSSTRISEVLRFRQALPPIVSIAHLHALSRSTTRTERELAMLIAQGRVRKITIPGRGKGGAAVGEGIVLVEEWKRRLQDEVGLDPDTKRKYALLLDTHRTSPTAPTKGFTSAEVRDLVVAGFLTNPAALSNTMGNLFARPTGSSLVDIASAGSSAATGTLAAIGGYHAIHDSGGGGSTLASAARSSGHTSPTQSEMTFALPATGAYLSLLVAARSHLLHLLRQLSPRHTEALRSELREKWEGNTPTDAINIAKRARGEFAGVLPGRTRRWREFYGMKFDWILAECVGSGLVELFDTGSVGVAVRAR